MEERSQICPRGQAKRTVGFKDDLNFRGDAAFLTRSLIDRATTVHFGSAAGMHFVLNFIVDHPALGKISLQRQAGR